MTVRSCRHGSQATTMSWRVSPGIVCRAASANCSHSLAHSRTATINESYSQPEMFRNANDAKSNVNLLSWVGFLEPWYSAFEGVREFLSYDVRGYWRESGLARSA